MYTCKWVKFQKCTSLFCLTVPFFKKALYSIFFLPCLSINIFLLRKLSHFGVTVFNWFKFFISDSFKQADIVFINVHQLLPFIVHSYMSSVKMFLIIILVQAWCVQSAWVCRKSNKIETKWRWKLPSQWFSSH